ncbi:MAG: aminotransferase class I/II-fold pyridoxal phosphate-dependent enzyme [Chloroflexota bacterium]|nr:aminotransferase class I/II-fold pyridoxal phosphate-dependent enzyme [Chloroflexota bacterium]
MTEPIFQGTVYAFHDPGLAETRHAADPSEPNYARDGLPNVRTLERAVAQLEGAEEGVAAASGMGAIALVFLAHLAAGDEVVISADCYCDTATLLREELVRFGVTAMFIDTCDPERLRGSLTNRTRLVYVETVSNPTMKLCDLARTAQIAHEAGALLVVDNTFATPALCRPLEHGADLVVHSATKFIGGHHDLIAGVVVGQRTLLERIRRCAYLYGPTLGSMDAWLALRGIKTLAPRMAWISETASAVAAFLVAHPAVAAVRYPGLPNHPQAALARRLLPDGAGGMLAFDLAGGPSAAEALICRLRMIAFAPSLGGTGTTVSYPPKARPAGNAAREPSASIRMSVGLEAAGDLIADLRQALDALPVPEVALGIDVDVALEVST